MESIKSIHGGVYALMLTPFKEDLSIDWQAYEGYVEWQLAQGAHRLFAACGSSEMMTLKLDERIKLAEIAVSKAGSTGVVATANVEPGWEAQVEEVKRMEQTGVSALVFTTKGYGDDQDRMFSYLSELASHTSLPIILYEYPGFKPKLMEAETYKKLAKTGRFVAIKDTTCTMPMIKEKIDVAGDTAILQANIPYLLESYKEGAYGVMATTSTAMVSIMRKMWDEFQSGNLDAARETHAQLVLLDSTVSSVFPSGLKYLANIRGAKMNFITRKGDKINLQAQHAIDVAYDWAKRNEILD